MNKPKVLRVVISTNRVEYLKQTIEACKKIDYSDLDMHHLLIDDFPKGRNDKELTSLVLNNGFDEIILNPKNIGITQQWAKIFNIVNDGNYDYVFMHEDDVKIIHPLKLSTLITILKEDPMLAQLSLKRNNWYEHESEVSSKKDSDDILGDYRLDSYDPLCNFFGGLMAVWPASVAKEPIMEDMDCLLSEAVIAHYLKEKYRKFTGLLKTADGGIMVEHIGEYTHGSRLEKGVPGYHSLYDVNIETKFSSRIPYTKYEK